MAPIPPYLVKKKGGLFDESMATYDEVAVCEFVEI